MVTNSILAAVDAEIFKLKEVRAILAQNGKVDAVISNVVAEPAKRRKMSKAARARIGEAQRKRWAAAKTAK